MRCPLCIDLLYLVQWHEKLQVYWLCKGRPEVFRLVCNRMVRIWVSIFPRHASLESSDVFSIYHSRHSRLCRVQLAQQRSKNNSMHIYIYVHGCRPQVQAWFLKASRADLDEPRGIGIFLDTWVGRTSGTGNFAFLGLRRGNLAWSSPQQAPRRAQKRLVATVSMATHTGI